jgi:hypothetical protein
MFDMKFTTTTLFFLIIFFSFGQSWSDGIGEIIQQNCVQCHRDGGVAPFPLETYEDVSLNAGLIYDAILQESMPPWPPNESYVAFAHSRKLLESDRNSVLNWLTGGMPEGDPFSPPSIPSFPTGSQLGLPDLSLTIPTFTVSGNDDVYYNFELPSGLSQAMFANAIEIIPGNSDIVHHVLVFQDSTNNTINPNSMGGTGSPASKLMYAFTPGAQPYNAPPGTGFRMPANTRIILQIHYAPGSDGQTDQTTVNFKLNSGPQREIFVEPLLNHANMTNGPLYIPANQTATFNEEFTVPINATLLYIFPHMHLIGESIRSWANLPISNDTIRLIDIPKWDFHWQDNFIFQNSIIIPTGTKIKAEAFYNNTTTNTHNPSSPPQNVTAGEGTYDEMMFVFFAYLLYQPGDENIIMDNRIFPKGATTICEGESVLLTAIEGVGYAYQWYRDGVAITGETNANLITQISGNYTVEISLGVNISISEPVEVTVNAINPISINVPVSNIIPINDSLLLETIFDPSYNYQWYLNGTAILDASANQLYADLPGAYFVVASNGCNSVSDTVILEAELSLDELKNGFSIFPNPTTNSFTIISEKVINSNFRLMDGQGRAVLTGTMNGQEHTMDISQLSKGVYSVVFEQQDLPVLSVVKE